MFLNGPKQFFFRELHLLDQRHGTAPLHRLSLDHQRGDLQDLHEGADLALSPRQRKRRLCDGQRVNSQGRDSGAVTAAWVRYPLQRPVLAGLQPHLDGLRDLEDVCR